MKVSVVMTTYNGEEFVLEQLKSIMLQTKKADEVLISDDNSTDNTIGIVKEFIEKYQLDNWILHINKKNMGWKKNFYNTILKSTGDIIFLADQDDVWMDTKLDEMTERLISNDKILLLASGYCLIDNESKEISNKNFLKNSSELSHLPFDKHFYITKYPGCSLAFKKTLIPFVKQLFFEKYPHDQLLWNIATILDGAYLYDKPLFKYRKHINSAMSTNNLADKRFNQIEKELEVVNNFKNFLTESGLEFSNEKVSIVTQTVEFAKIRHALFQQFGTRNLFRLIKYYSFYPRKRTLFGDLEYILNVNNKVR